jgi:hypothetical protein
MNRPTHLRNAAIASLVVGMVLLLLTVQLPAQPVQAQADFAWNSTSVAITITPGQTGSATNTLRNNSGEARTLNISVTGAPSGWQIAIFPSTSIVLNAGASTSFTFSITPPSGTTAGTYNLQLVATRADSTTITSSALLAVTVVSPTATLTSTTAPATVTPTPGPVCVDNFEPDNSPAAARTIDVNTAQQHAICPSNDEDWLLFGGVAGKIYTIDVSRQDPGIDLTLELFDKNLNSIAFNDDFFNRDPNAPNPGDTKPRITIRIPSDGRYYVKVRDAAGRGGVNYIYNIALLDESYGPTPTLVREICQDLFEPDGLPEQAHLITSNELQEERRLCPSGDADWVTFFGKAGKRYIIFTDTRRYVGTNKVNGQTQAGADTVMVLTDRDGVSLLDVNDDIPGGSTLDSQIEFAPEVDGFYFVQIKNVGDIGGQFIRYDLTLLLCLPGQTDCGRGDATTGVPARPITPQATGTPADDFTLDPTSTPRPTSTPTATKVP